MPTYTPHTLKRSSIDDLHNLCVVVYEMCKRAFQKRVSIYAQIARTTT